MAERKIKVNAGETYMDIAKRELGDVTQAKTLQKNNPGRLRAGMEITLPDNTTTTQTVQAPGTVPPMTPMKTEIPVATGAPMTPTPPVPGTTPTAPPLSMSGQAPTPVLRDPNAPALSVSGQAPVYDPRTTATSPNGIGAPNVGRSMYQGGKQTFDIFEKMKSGVINPNQTPVTPAEKEAVAMYQNYQKYQNADAQTLLGAIQSGELTPDKTNLLWRALGQNGEPTDAMVQAYAMWDKGIKAGADGKRTKDPFLGGEWQNIASEADANAMINDFSGEDNTVDGEVVSSTDGGVSTGNGTVTKGTSEYDMYRQTIIDMMAQQPTGGSDYQGQLAGLRSKYNVQQDEQGLQSLDDEAMAIENDLIARRNQARSQPVAMGVIAGRVGEIERQQMERLNQVNRDRQYLANSLAQKQSIIGQFMEAYGMDYESAREDFDTRYNRSLQAIDMFRTIRKDEVAEQSAIASAELAQKKYEDEKVQQRKDDAKAKLEVMYGAITDGTMDPNLLKTDAMKLQVAQMEIQAGYPIGWFTGLRDKNPDKTYRTTTEHVNEKGEKIITAIFTDKNTGEPSFYKQNIGVDAKSLQDIQKGVYDIAKAKNDAEMAPLDRQFKQAQIDASMSTTFAKDVESGRNVDYFSNYGSITGENGSPLWKWGLDVDLKKGDPVFAPFDGEVIGVDDASSTGGFGNRVQIRDSAGNTVWLSHLDGFAAKVGDKVKAGQQVAIGGNTGNTIPGPNGDGSHLDITIKKPNGSYMTAPEVKRYIQGKYGVNVKSNAKEDKPTEGERKETNQKKLINEVQTAFTDKDIAGKDGKVSPAAYEAMKKRWVSELGDPKQFDELFIEYINPTHYDDYNIDSKIKKEYDWISASDKYEKNKPASTIYDNESDPSKPLF